MFFIGGGPGLTMPQADFLDATVEALVNDVGYPDELERVAWRVLDLYAVRGRSWAAAASGRKLEHPIDVDGLETVSGGGASAPPAKRIKEDRVRLREVRDMVSRMKETLSIVRAQTDEMAGWAERLRAEAQIVRASMRAHEVAFAAMAKRLEGVVALFD